MKKNIDRRFVGREEELADFDEILSNPRGERRIKYIWGPGGIGKTWLALRMLDRASKKSALNLQLIDMYSTNMRHTEGVMNEIIRRLKSFQQVDPSVYSEYENVQQLLANARGSSGYSPQGVNVLLRQLEEVFRVCVQTTTTNHVLVLAFDTFEHVRSLPVGRWILDEKGLQMPGLVCVIASRPDPKNPPEHQLSGLSDEDAIKYYYAYTRSPEPEATVKVFLKQLNQKVNGNPLLLGLAIFWRDLDELKTEMLDTPISDFKKKIVWSLRSTEGSGARNLGNIRLDEPLYQTLVCMAYLNRRFNEFFLNKLVENGYIHLRGKTQGAIWQELQKDHLFFVKGRPEGEVQLHDELASMFKEYLLSDVFDEIEGQPGEKWRRFVTQIVDWYDELLGQDLDDTTLAVYRVEKLGYLLQIDAPETRRRPDLGKAESQLFDYGRENSDILHQLLLDEIDDESLMLFSSIRDRYDIVVLLAKLAMRINQISKSHSLWEKAVSIAQEMEDREAEVDALVGPNTWQSDPDYCLVLLERARALSEQHCPRKLPIVLYGLGFAHRRKQNLKEARRWYGKARIVASRLGDEYVKSIVRNDMGYIYLLMGDYGKAAADIKEAREHRTKHIETLRAQREHECSLHGIRIDGECDVLRDEIQDAAWMTGLSYNTLGEMERYTGNLPKAIEYYNEALMYFEEAGNRYWRMICLYSRGEAKRRYAMIKHQAGLFESAQHLDNEAYSDIVDSLEILKNYGFFENEHTAKRRMGRLFHDRGLRSRNLEDKKSNFEEAHKYFEEALMVALNTGNVLEELENLTEIAFLADDMLQLYLLTHNDSKSSLRGKGELERLKGYLHLLEEGLDRHTRDSVHIYEFDIFRHLLEMEKGAFSYTQKEYTQALEFYLESFTGLASDPGYGLARFRQHSGHLVQQIMNLPDSQHQIEWALAFNNKWNEVGSGDIGKKLTEVQAVKDLLYEMFVKVEDLIYEEGLEELFEF